MNKFNIVALLLLSFLVTGCSTSTSRYKIKDDHSPSDIPPLENVEDANPRYEPYSRGGNKNYRVRGIDYKVFSDITEFTETGNASWYGNKFHGHLTSNGERYNMFAMSAAHKNLPLPSYIQVTNLENNKQIIVRVNDRGPFHSGRIVDLSYAAAKKLDMLKAGTARVKIKLLHFKNKKQQDEHFTGIYYIQYLVTSLPEKANQLGKKLSATYQVKSLQVQDNNHYKLRLGPFTNQLQADNLLKKIQLDYPNAFIIEQK
ncbi:MAG: rare lipoprotein A [Psychromonas sp.]|jgi:rare lipoprotein A|uniref:septal ring lytic transglycosylase RlpA family protein n=1 Tax=Psychromonas sp. TaxID=1884585 RepID=UPI0039E68D1E